MGFMPWSTWRLNQKWFWFKISQKMAPHWLQIWFDRLGESGIKIGIPGYEVNGLYTTPRRLSKKKLYIFFSYFTVIWKDIRCWFFFVLNILKFITKDHWHLAMGKCLWFSAKIKICQSSLSSPWSYPDLSTLWLWNPFSILNASRM